MIPAPAKMTQGAAVPLTSVAPITTTSTPTRRNLGHQRVRRVRAKRAVLRRAGLPAGTAGRPSAPGNAGTAGLALSLRRDRQVILLGQQLAHPRTREYGLAPLLGHAQLPQHERECQAQAKPAGLQ